MISCLFIKPNQSKHSAQCFFLPCLKVPASRHTSLSTQTFRLRSHTTPKWKFSGHTRLFCSWATFGVKNCHAGIFSLDLHYSPWPPLSSSIANGNHTLMFTSSPRPAIGSKKLFVTGPQAAMRQHHDTDCTVRSLQWCRRPRLSTVPRLIACKVLHDSQSTLSHQGRVPGQIARNVVCGYCAHTWKHLIPLYMWPWCICPCLHLRICPHTCKEILFCAQVPLRLTVLRPRKCQGWLSISFSICLTFFSTFGTPSVSLANTYIRHHLGAL